MLFGVSIQWKTTTNTLIQKTEYSSLICVSEAECRGVVALLFKKTNFTGKQSLASFPLAFFSYIAASLEPLFYFTLQSSECETVVPVVIDT